MPIIPILDVRRNECYTRVGANQQSCKCCMHSHSGATMYECHAHAFTFCVRMGSSNLPASVHEEAVCKVAFFNTTIIDPGRAT